MLKCQFCGKDIPTKRKRSHVICKLCNKIACTATCSKYSLCLEHYNQLSDDQQKKYKRFNTIYFLSIILSPLMLLFLLFIIGGNLLDYYESNRSMVQVISLGFAILFAIIVTIFKTKSEKRILNGLA